MNKKTELIKYGVLALIIGIIIGIIDTIFGKGLILVGEIRNNYFWYLVPFLPIAGLLITWLYRHFNELSLKGMTLVFETGQQKRDAIPLALIPLVMICTWLTHLFGGSAGREGVAVQIGAAVSHTIGKKFEVISGKTEKNGKIFLIMGMAAGFGGLFQTPLAATFFALEVLVVGALFYEAMLPAMSAAFTASFTSHLLGLEKFSVSFSDTFSVNPQTIAKLILIAIVFGITGGAFSYFLAFAKEKLAKFIKNPYRRIFFTGIILSILFLLLWKGRYCGLGTNLISASFAGEKVYVFDFLLKAVFTIVTLAAGFQGGEVTPLFSIGATLGVILASALGLPVLLVAGLGYAAVFGSATNTLIAPILIGVEVFGPEHVVWFAIICMIAFDCNGNKTIYGKQRLSKMSDFNRIK